MTITAHCLVKNEARFVWYAVMSVIDHVDKVLLWDTGSTDGTLQIIDAIRKTENARLARAWAKRGRRKVSFKKCGEVTPDTFAKVRQAMLDETDTDWFLVVDGDEIWWQDSIRHLVSEVKEKGDEIESIVVPTYNLVGDIYHYLPPDSGLYRFAHRDGTVKGHFNLRAVNRKIPGLASFGPHGQWGWVDGEGKMIQYRDPKKILFVGAPYLHATNIPRAASPASESIVPKRKLKRKYEFGIPFPADFYYPEVFFRPRPKIVPSPWEKMSFGFKTRAFLETPFRRIKRRLVHKVGY